MEETRWFYDLTTEESKQERVTLVQRLIAGLGVVCLIVLIGMATAHAAPAFSVRAGEVLVTLYDEPCKLKKEVSNLPYRATWEEKGKTFEGCFGASPDLGIALVYFADKTVGAIPLSALVKVRSA